MNAEMQKPERERGLNTELSVVKPLLTRPCQNSEIPRNFQKWGIKYHSPTSKNVLEAIYAPSFSENSFSAEF